MVMADTDDVWMHSADRDRASTTTTGLGPPDVDDDGPTLDTN